MSKKDNKIIIEKDIIWKSYNIFTSFFEQSGIDGHITFKTLTTKMVNNIDDLKIFFEIIAQLIEKENEFKRMCFYLVVSGDNIKEIQEIVGLNQQYLKTANLSFEKITNNVEINEIFKQLYLPYSNKQNIFNIIEKNKIEIHKNYYKINDTFLVLVMF